MKVKKVDQKPMVIHTKKASKIHFHGITKDALKQKETSKPKDGLANVKRQRKDSFQKGREKKLPFRQITRKMHQANTSIKTKDTKLYSTKAALVAGSKAVTNQMDGGKEIEEASGLLYEAARPVFAVSNGGYKKWKEHQIQNKLKIRKSIVSRKNHAIEKIKMPSEKTSENSSYVFKKKPVKGAEKSVSKATVNKADLPVNINPVEENHRNTVNRSRKLAYFLDKMKAQEEQKDSVGALVKDILKERVILSVKSVGSFAGIICMVLLLLVLMIACPVALFVGTVYNSPFSIFFPSVSSAETVQTVTSAYVSEFQQEVSDLANAHEGCDEGRIVYVDFEGDGTDHDNYYDILAVYMVKYGTKDTAAVINDTSKAWIKSVVNDMCSYTTSTGTETVMVTDDDGNEIQSTKTVYYVNVSLKSYSDMITEYALTENQEQMLRDFMTPDNLTLLGWSGETAGGGNPGVCSMTEADIQTAMEGITDSVQLAVCDFAFHRVGYPYSQEFRDSGNYYDCSSLAYYSWKAAGIDISYQRATTAASEAQGLEAAGKEITYEEMVPGDLIFYSYESNGRYKNITHVAIYVGNGKIVEARNERYGIVYRDTPGKGSVVSVCSPLKKN